MSNIQENYSQDQLDIISEGQITVTFDVSAGDYIRLTLLDENGNYLNRQFFSNVNTTDTNGNTVPEIGIYSGVGGNIFLKPNEILDINKVPSGNYILQFDFLRDSTDSDNTLQTGYFIKEISPSRKEVRLLDDENTIDGDEFDNLLIDDGNGNQIFDYNWVLGVSAGQNLSIVNRTLDTVSNPDSNSWILKLNRPLPNNISTLSKCFVAREVLSTQTQNIVYISSITQVSIGGGLTPDTNFSYENTTIGGDIAQNKNELLTSASLSEGSLESILSSINNKDVNLNIDFNDYENHIHFGSAVKKLENFKTKVIEINEALGAVSASLTMTSSHSGSIANERKSLFEKIRNVQNNFTPYERFLYYDGQSQTTSSAPGIGTNYAKSYAMRYVIGPSNDESTGGVNDTSSLLPNYDGFNSVYNVNTKEIADTKVQLFDDTYLAEQSPFFNYSGSVYLSFVMKGAIAPTHINTNMNYGDTDNLSDSMVYNRAIIPQSAHSSSVIQMPGYGDSGKSFATGSHYERYIFKANQLYWRPSWQADDSGSYPNIDDVSYNYHRAGDIGYLTDSDFASDKGGNPTPETSDGKYQILSGSNLNSDYLVTEDGGNPIVIKDSSGKYGNLLSPAVTDSEGNIVTDMYRTGSFILPSGDLFALRLTSSNAFNALLENSASYITDIKVTKNNPLNALPFTSIYHTGSSEWKDWYTSSYDSAVSYDEKNIHSFENNLPDYIKRSRDYGDLKIFLAMIGEHFDLIRNYIDNQTNFYSKSYKNYNETGSKQSTIPNNVLPMIAENLGWEFINPYTGSLETYFNIVSEGGETLEEVKSETWRKVLNNLMYIYKTKGTINSVNALLNTYGYPHEALEISEIGGQSEHMNPNAISNEDTDRFLEKGGLFRATGSIHAIKKNKIFYSLNLTDTATTSKKLHLDWWTNNAKADTIEFVFKSNNSSSATQVVLESSGSGTLTGSSTLWDLRLMPSASVSGTLSGSVQFRLNNSLTGALDIGDNNFNMSTGDLPLFNGKLWNIMLRRDSSSLDSSVTQSYKLYAGLQNINRIQHFSVTSMSIEGNASGSSASNANFIGTGSLTVAPSSASSNVSGNLVVGRTLTGSMGEIRIWSGSLSSSKFKQHILNKFSVVGNTATASIDDIFYRFRLNENYGSASIEDNIIDANENSPANTPTNYTRDIGFPSASYNVDKIFTIGLSPRIDFNIQNNKTKGLINPPRTIIRNLNPTQRSTLTVYEPDKFDNKPKRAITTKIELVKNLNKKVDDYILENFSDVDLSDMIANPSDYYSSSYSELESFREKAFKGIKVDANKFIDNVADTFNEALIQNVKSILPAHSTLNNVGVMIKPTLLERNKYKHHRADIFYGTGSGVGFYESNTFNFYYEKSGSVSGSHNRDLFIFNLSGSEYISYYEMKEPLYLRDRDSGSGIYNFTGSKKFSPYNPIDNIYPNGSGNSSSYFYLTTGSKLLSPYEMKEPLYLKSRDSGSSEYNFTGSKYFSTYNGINDINFGGDSGSSYFHLTTGSKYISQYNMKEPLYLRDRDSGSSEYNFTGSKYFSTYNPIDNIYPNGSGNSSSYFYLTTGSGYISQYNMKVPLYFKGKDSGSGIYDFTGSKYFSTYNPIDNIDFDNSGSYFYLTTGSEYFSLYEMITPLTLRNKDSGSSHYFFTGSEYLKQYNLINNIHYGGGSGSYFNLTTGSKYFKQYDMNRNLNFYWEYTGSSDDYIMNLSHSTYIKPYEENTITSSKSSGTGSVWGDTYTRNINSQIRDLSGLYNLDRTRRDGTQFAKSRHPLSSSRPLGVTPSYIWDAWGTGSDDIHFLTGFMSESRKASATNILNASGSHTSSFTINVPTSNGGYGGMGDDITLKFVSSASFSTGSVDVKTVHMFQDIHSITGSSMSGSLFIFHAINGTTSSAGNTVIKYGQEVTSSQNFLLSGSGIHGVSASINSQNITLTATEPGKLWNNITLANVAGSVYDTGVTFSNGADRHLIDVNRGYYNREFIFKLIGDVETLYEDVAGIQGMLTSSYSNKEYAYLGERITPTIDYANLHNYRNKIIVDTGKGFQHKGLYPTGSDVNSISETKETDGRPMGRTLYFVTSSDGTILYPPNHHVIAKSSKESISKIIYGGRKYTTKLTGSKQGYYDPKGLDPTPEKDVTTINVAGSNTDTGLFVVNRGGSKINTPSGSIGKTKK